MKNRHVNVNSNNAQTNITLSRCSREEFQIEENKGGVAKNDSKLGSVMLKTGSIPNSWIRAFRPGIPVNFANNIRFSFKGYTPEDKFILTRIGVGIEGLDDNADLSKKFGLEGYNDKNVSGSCYHLITSNGISMSTDPTLLPIKDNNPRCCTLIHKPGVSCTLSYIDENTERLNVTTCSIPGSGAVYNGMSFGIKTFNKLEKKMSLVSTSLLTNYVQT
jgi:hypothetical protein